MIESKVGSTDTPALRDLTTFRVGGSPAQYLKFDNESDIVEAVCGIDAVARQSDAASAELLVLGGGSNLLISDAPFPGTVIRDVRQDIRVVDSSDCGGVTVRVTAGTVWDDLVAHGVESGWSGLEALSGIPGVVGAAPVQNIGAYGQEVASNLASVRALDRSTGKIVTLSRSDLLLGYRDSILKQSLGSSDAGGGRTWGPTGRWVVLDVELHLQAGNMSAPVGYHELARSLGVALGERAPVREVRDAVLELRSSKGMVLDESDHDTWSAGSFFTNPILSDEDADRLLPPDAPKFGVENRSMMALSTPNRAAPMVPGVVKTSAAWLISRAGFEKGYRVRPDSAASLSTKHVLALTNRGGATAKDITDLASEVRRGVFATFGVELKPEPVLVGVSLGAF